MKSWKKGLGLYAAYLIGRASRVREAPQGTAQRRAGGGVSKLGLMLYLAAGLALAWLLFRWGFQV